MKKRKLTFLTAILCILAVIASGCGKEEKKNTDNKDKKDGKASGKVAEEQSETEVDEHGNVILKGYYMTFGEDEYVFFEEVNESPFYAEIPEGELYEESGERIEQKDLKDGDLIACYGSGVMLESYPGQYPGVTKMVRLEDKGVQVELQHFQEMIQEFYQEPDPSETPYLNIGNQQKEAIVTTMTEQFSSEWTYQDENGKEQTIAECKSHVLDAKELVDINCNGEDKSLQLMFSKKPEKIEVKRWDYGTSSEEADKGEKVTVTEEDGEFYIKNAVSSSIYEVTGFWENGNVVYGFWVK